MKYLVEVDDQTLEFDIAIDESGATIRHEERELTGNVAGGGEAGSLSLLLDGESYEAYIAFADGVYTVTLGGHVFRLSVEEAARARLHGLAGGHKAHEGPTTIAAPMPGLVIGIPVEVGQAVKRGETVLILQAMKMENELRAPRDGTVASIQASPGQTVAQGQALLTLE